MLRITKQTDIGIMLLAHMASFPPHSLLTARGAANWSGISQPMASKILKRLAKSQIIVSQRGYAGGYSLAAPPEDTTVADVIRALEGPISMVECGIHPGQCEQESICPTRTNWTRINRVVEQALEQVHISEMVAQ